MAVDLAGTGHTIVMRRWEGDRELIALFHFGGTTETVEVNVKEPEWKKLLDSADPRWLGRQSAIPAAISAPGGRLRVSLQPDQCLVLDTAHTKL